MTDGEYKKQNLTNDLHTLYCTSKGGLFRFYLNISFGWKAIQCMKMDNGRFIKCWVSRYFEYLSDRMHMYYPCGVFRVFINCMHAILVQVWFIQGWICVIESISIHVLLNFLYLYTPWNVWFCTRILCSVSPNRRLKDKMHTIYMI